MNRSSASLCETSHRALFASLFASTRNLAGNAAGDKLCASIARLTRLGVVCLLAAISLLLLTASAAMAQTSYTVTRFDDTAANGPNTGDGLGTGASGDLRYGLLAAMTAGGTNTINFSGCTTESPCTITLQGPLPPIYETATSGAQAISSFNLTIDGGAEGAVLLDGGGAYRVFFVDNVTVTLNNLVIQNALAQGGAGGAGTRSGGGGAGFGAGLFVNQATAVVTVENTYFLNDAATGGAGGGSNQSNQNGGGGGLAFAGSSTGTINSGGGGGGVTGPGVGSNGGSGGGGAAGAGSATGGAGYADNNGGAKGGGHSSGKGGFGGGGGGSPSTGNSGNAGGFGGGGGGGALTGSAGAGGFGGGGGSTGAGTASAFGGVSGGHGGNPGGGGGAAAGPAIFVVSGSVTLSNVTGSGFMATAGAGGGTATAGTASAAPVFNYTGTVNGSTAIGGMQGVIPVGGNSDGTVYGGTPVSQTSAIQTATLWMTAAGTPANINVLTQGAQGLDFQGAKGGTCSTSTSYTAGESCTVNFTFAPLYPGLRMGAITLVDGSGNLLASVFINGLGTGPEVVFSTLASLAQPDFIPSSTSVLGIKTSYPGSVAVDSSGNVYVASYGNNSVKEIVAVGGIIPASNPTILTLGGGFQGPVGVAVDGAGNVYVADGSDNPIKEIPSGCVSSGCVITLGGSYFSGGFTTLQGVAVDGSGNVYVTDYGAGALREMPPNCVSASCVSTVVSGFQYTAGVALDGIGNVYVADSGHNAITEIPVGCKSFACVITLGSGFNNPYGVAVDGGGNVYVGDSGNNAVDEMYPGCTSSSCVFALGGGFNRPLGVAVDGNGNVYVADQQNNQVKELNFATPPSLSFATTNVGATSTDSPQIVAVQNIGNTALTFPVPVSGGNPSIAPSFTLLSGGGILCPVINTGSLPGTLPASQLCLFGINFVPASQGSISGSLVLTDDNLNANLSTQSIPLSGTGLVLVAPTTATVSAVTVPFGSTAGVTVTATESGSAGVVTGGIVSFSTGRTGGGGGTFNPTTCTLTVSGTCTTTFTPFGNMRAGSYLNDVIASFAANNSYAAANGTDQTNTLTVTQQTTSLGTMTFSPAASEPFGASQSVTITDTLSYTGSGAAPSGLVMYLMNGLTYIVSARGCTGSSSPLTCSYNVPAAAIAKLPVNGYTVTATYAAQTDVNYAGSTGASGTFTIAKLTPTFGTMSFSPVASQTYGTSQSVTVSDTLSYTGTVTPTGAVTFGLNSVNYTATCTGSISPLTCTYAVPAATIAALPATGYAVTVAYTTDTDYSAATGSSGALTITKATPGFALVSSLNPVLVQTPITLTATLTGPTAPTGTVVFTDTTTSPAVTLGSITAVNGVATLSTSTLTVGSHFITATYSGDANFNGKTSTLLTEVVQDFSLGLSATGGGNSILSATVQPGGTAVFILPFTPSTVGGTFPATITLTASGGPAGSTYTFSPTTLAAGTGWTDVTLSVHVPLSSTSSQSVPPNVGRKFMPFAFALLLLPFAGGLRKAGKRIRMLSLILMLACLGGVLGLTGCISSRSTQTYPITVTGTSGALSHSTTVTLTVD